MVRRFDNRTKEEFCKDIAFGTKIEAFWIKVWIEELKNWPEYKLLSVTDHGVDNSGKFVAQSNGNADFYIKYYHYGDFKEHPLEIKWAPSNDKATFKITDLNNYIKTNSSMLLIFNTSETNLKRPPSYNYQKHLDNIIDHMPQIKWGIIDPPNISRILNKHTHFPVPYMGNKMGLIVIPEDFSKYMVIRDMRHSLDE